jgi:hypothetical protein
MLVGVFALVAAAGLFWLAYRRPRPRRWLLPRRQPVPARSSTAVRLATTPVTASDAGKLEAELDRPLGRDAAEQAGRWAEAAAALRKSHRTDALPAVLRCVDAAAGVPRGDLLAAEAVSFPNFPATLHDLAALDGRRAVRALARATRGARDGAVDLATLILAGIGDHLAAVSEKAPAGHDPWVTAAILEAERVARRAGHWTRLLPADVGLLAERQGTRLAASGGRRHGWLSNSPARLTIRFPVAPADEQAAILRMLGDMRADVSTLFPTIPDRRNAWWADAIRCLRWSVGRDYGPLLAELADRLLAARHPGPAAATVLSALRGGRCQEAERVSLEGAGHADASIRRAAIGALGWTDPYDTAGVIARLKTARSDGDVGVRRAATAALARFGELAALRELAQGLLAEEPQVRQATALWAAEEGVTWLWPDLDLVAAHADPDTALAATEGLERMREAAVGLLD